jgi:hypothetical protein
MRGAMLLLVALLATAPAQVGAQPADTGGAADSAPEPAPESAPESEKDAPGATTASGDEAGDAPNAQAQPQACVPDCRTGFVCIDGGCVSACNPPCAEGERCNADGECDLPPRPPPAPGSGADDAGEWTSREPGAPGGRVLPPDAYRHDGFFMRGTIGVGAIFFDEDYGSGRTELDYASLSLGLDIGGAPVENFIIHGRLAIATASEVELDDPSPNSAPYDNVDLTAVMLGPAVTYYVMPVNVYVTAAVGAAAIVVGDSTDGDDSNYGGGGYGLGLDVGWEGWGAPQAGVGGALRLQYMSASHEAESSLLTDSDLQHLLIGAVFSVTYQ